MATDLERRIIAAREKWVTVGGHDYKVRRPLAVQVRSIFNGDEEFGLRLALDCVVDWRGMLEQELLPGIGTDAEVAFEPGLYRQWIGDRLEDIRELADLIWADFLAHKAKAEAVPGK